MVALIITILLISGGIVTSASGLQLSHFSLFAGGNTAPATITITSDSRVEQGSYVIQALTSNADPTKRQVSLRQLTFLPQKQSKSVTATGHTQIPGKAATGQLTFYNGSAQDYWIASTTVIPGPNGVSVVPDGPVSVPAGNPPTYGTVIVNAHVTNAGTNGNMPAGAINKICCAPGGFIKVISSAFRGGQDQKIFTFLQQSDADTNLRSVMQFSRGRLRLLIGSQVYFKIALLNASWYDGVVNQFKPTLSQQALNGFKGQIKSNEQLVGDPQCATQPNVDQPVGDQGQNVATANVTVNATCTGLAYDASGAQTLAHNLLKRKAVSSLGQSYALAGTIVTKQRVTDIDVKDGVVTLQVAVAGTWYYQFDDKQKQTLAKQLANKSRDAAQRLLNDYRGAAKARIDITVGNGNTLPEDPEQISIVMLAVSGTSPTDLPTLPAVVPTSPLSLSRGR